MNKTKTFILEMILYLIFSLILDWALLGFYQKYLMRPQTVIQVTANLVVNNPTMEKNKKINFKSVNIDDKVGMKKLEKETGISDSTMKALVDASKEERNDNSK